MDKQQNLSDLIPDRQELESFINDYAKRKILGTSYIPTEVFIRYEIEDITKSLLEQKVFVVEVPVSPSQTAKPFMHATCATKVYEALTRGRDLTVGQIIEAAKTECVFSNTKNRQYGYPVCVPINEEFEAICYTWIKKGVAFVYYIQYLYRKMQDPALTLDKFTINLINKGDGNVINIGHQNVLDVNISLKKGENPEESSDQRKKK